MGRLGLLRLLAPEALDAMPVPIAKQACENNATAFHDTRAAAQLMRQGPNPMVVVNIHFVPFG
jgi:hypothetical protein